MAGTFQRTIRDGAGNILAGVACEVRDPVTDALVDIFTDAALTTPKANPGVTDADGRFDFFAADTQTLVNVTAGAGLSAFTLQNVLIAVPQAKPYANRAAAVTAIAAGLPAPVVKVSWIAKISALDGWQVLSVYKSSGATAISDMLGWVPIGDLSAKHFGAVGGYSVSTWTGPDDTAALLAMVAYVNASGVAEVFIDDIYYTNSPLIFNRNNVRITPKSGANLGSSISQPAIVGGHTAGPVIHLRRSKNILSGISVLADPTRIAGAYGIMNAGVIIGDFDWTTPTTVGSAAGFTTVEKNLVRGHPGPGILTLGGGAEIEANYVDQNKGSGILCDNGQGIASGGSSGLGFPGWSTLKRNKCEANGGHGIQIGWLTRDAAYQPAYRWSVENNDVNGNCLVPANCQNDYNIFISADSAVSSVNVCNGAFGLFADGFDQTHSNNRFVGTTGYVFGFGPLSTGITLNGFRLIGPPAPLDPAVYVDASITAARGCGVRLGANSNITNLVAAADVAKLAFVEYGSRLDRGGLVAAQSLTVGGLTVAPARAAVTPTVTFATPGDLVVDSYITQSAEYMRHGNLAFISVALQWSWTYTTASGVFLVSLSGLPFSMSSAAADFCGMSIAQMGRVTLDALDRQVIVRPNSASGFRVVFVRSGGDLVSANETNFTSGTLRSITFSGWVKIA